MPYAQDIVGIYKIVNIKTGACYVGQSQRVKKRVKEHFRLLNLNKHPNPKLQHAYNKYGREAFTWEIEAVCEDVDDLDLLEESFLSGKAWFDTPVVFNIADFAKAPMRGKKHTDESRKRIANGRRNCGFNYQSATYRSALKQAQKERWLSNPDFVAKIKYIVENDTMTYAERARALGADLSSVRRLYLRYKHLKGNL